jgi:metal-sulfur cluster biosynthetic enzyme
MFTADEVLDRLREVYDPEIGINIVDLGLIYAVTASDRKVSVLMTLTTPGCPLGETVEASVRQALSALPEIREVDLQLTFEPPWGPERMSPSALAALGWPAQR